MSDRRQLVLTCVAIFCATLFAVSDVHGQKGGKGGGGHNHGGGGYNHGGGGNDHGGGGHNHGGGGSSFLDISPWGVGYSYQDRNFGISVGPVGGALLNGGYGSGYSRGYGIPAYDQAPCYDTWNDPWYGQPTLPMATPGYIVPSQPTYYAPQGMTTNGPITTAPGNPAIGNPDGAPSKSNTQPASVNIPGRPIGNTWLDQSISAFRSGDYANANRLAMHALLDTPDNGWLKLYASQCQLAVGDFVASAELVATAIETLPPEQWNSVVANFREFYHRNDYVTHMKSLEDKVKQEETGSWGKALLGYHYLYLGHPASAKKALDASLLINPEDPIAKRLLPLTEPVKTSKPGVDSPTPAPDAATLPPLQPEEARSAKSVLN